MIKKIIFGLFPVLFLTGFTVTYDVEIVDDEIKEKFTVVEKDMNLAKEENEVGESFEDIAKRYGSSYDLYTSFYNLYADNPDISECINNCSIYDKEYIEEDDKVGFRLSHTFNFKDYADSSIANEIIPGFQTVLNDKTLLIGGGSSWNFINGYNNFEKIEINIKTDYDVDKTNGKKTDNKYTWTIYSGNTENMAPLSFTLNINEEDNKIDNIMWLIVLLVILVLGVIIYSFLKKRKEHNAI